VFCLHRRATISVVVLTSMISACGGSAFPIRTGREQSNLGGDGLPVQMEDLPIRHEAHPVSGLLQLNPNGCWAADLDASELLVIFPVGFQKPLEDGSVMRSPDGQSFRDGGAFEGWGAVVPVELLPGVPDGFMGGYLAFCDSAADEVIVLDSIRGLDDAVAGEVTG
jgi:hypothetical protein